MVYSKEKKLPIVEIEEDHEEPSNELKDEQSAAEEEGYSYRQYPYFDVF